MKRVLQTSLARQLYIRKNKLETTGIISGAQWCVTLWHESIVVIFLKVRAILVASDLFAWGVGGGGVDGVCMCVLYLLPTYRD